MAPPINDNLANARIITGDDAYLGETTVDATSESAENAAGYGEPSVWYRLEWPADGEFRISVANATDGYYYELRRPIPTALVTRVIPGVPGDDLDETYLPTTLSAANFSQTVADGAFRNKSDASDSSIFTLPHAAGTVRYIWFADADFNSLTVGSFDISFDFVPAGSPPVNDDLADARLVTGDVSFVGETTLDSTPESGDFYPSVWYRLEWPATGRWNISVANATDGYDFVLYKPNVDPPADPTDISYAGSGLYSADASDDSTSTPRYGAGLVRYVKVQAAAFDGSFVESFDIDFDFIPGSGGTPPANDDVANAVEILASGNTDSVDGTTVDATIEEGYEDNDSNGWFAPSVWYAFNPSVSGRLIVTVSKTGGTTDWVPEADLWRIPTYPPSNADDWDFIDYAGDGTSTPPPEHMYPVKAGEHYLISVEDYNYDNAEEGDFHIDFKYIPSPLRDDFEESSLDPDVWIMRRSEGYSADPNTGYWSFDTTYFVDGAQSLKVQAPSPDAGHRRQLVYADVSEGGDWDRDYWLAYRFKIASWSDVWFSDTGDVELPEFLATNIGYPDGGSNLVSERGGPYLWADLDGDDNPIGYLEDWEGNDHLLSAGDWHELRIKARAHESNGKLYITQILDGEALVTDSPSFSSPGPVYGIAWTATRNFGGGVSPLWVDPIVWSPDTDPGFVGPAFPDFLHVPFISPGTTVYVPTLDPGNVDVDVPFITPTTTVFGASIQSNELPAPFIGPTTSVFTPFLLGENPALLSQEPVEVVLAPTDQQARLSQEPVEIVVLPTDAKARLSQGAVEVVVRNVYEDVNIFFIDYQMP